MLKSVINHWYKYEVYKPFVQMKRFRGIIKEVHAQIDEKNVKNCHAKFHVTYSIVSSRVV